MSYPAAAVANELLSLADRDGRSLTQIEIQKLVYFSHGWHLALRDQNLIEDPIEAWTYGPVVRRLYDAFKKFGSSQITEKAFDWSSSPGGGFSYCIPVMQSDSLENDAYSRAVVQSVWAKYGLIPPFKLVEITHLAGSPWQQARENGRKYIPNTEIKAYFKQLIEGDARR
jgi:uncharacterized phage-associated protein